MEGPHLTELTEIEMKLPEDAGDGSEKIICDVVCVLKVKVNGGFPSKEYTIPESVETTST